MEGFGLPGMVKMIQKGSSNQDHDKHTPHPFEGLHTEVFHIESGFLVKAVGMLNMGPTAPGDKSGLCIVSSKQRAVGEQANIAVKIRVMDCQ